jgi:hypothetical protein
MSNVIDTDANASRRQSGASYEVESKIEQCKQERCTTPLMEFLYNCAKRSVVLSEEDWALIRQGLSVNSGKRSKRAPMGGYTIRNWIAARMVERYDEICKTIYQKNRKLSRYKIKEMALEEVRAEFKNNPDAPRSISAIVKIVNRSDDVVTPVLAYRAKNKETLRREGIE